MGNIPGKKGKITDFKELVYETEVFVTCKYFVIGYARSIWPLLFLTRTYFAGTINDVKELLKRFRSQVFGFAMVEAQFESIMNFHKGVVKHVPLEVLTSCYTCTAIRVLL